MSELSKIKLTFPVTQTDNGYEVNPFQIRLNNNELTFMIENIKSRNPCIVYFKFYGYNHRKTLIGEYTSSKWVITREYSKQYETFEINFAQIPNSDKYYTVDDLDNFYMDLFIVGVDSENPIYFNHLQLNEGEVKEYHTPNEEVKDVKVGFEENKYINLYGGDDTYLQIIRPVGEDISTSQLTPSQTTIIAPHLPEESTFDDPISIFYEFMYMNEQIIGVEK